jgi:hypothetical protein
MFEYMEEGIDIVLTMILIRHFLSVLCLTTKCEVRVYIKFKGQCKQKCQSFLIIRIRVLKRKMVQ